MLHQPETTAAAGSSTDCLQWVLQCWRAVCVPNTQRLEGMVHLGEEKKKKVSEMKQNLLNHVFFFFNLNAVCGETCSPGVAIPVVLQSRAFC